MPRQGRKEVVGMKEILVVRTKKDLYFKAEDWILESDGVILLSPEVYKWTEKGEKVVIYPAFFPGVKLSPQEIETVTRIQLRG